jgi:hypothetical protein
MVAQDGTWAASSFRFGLGGHEPGLQDDDGQLTSSADPGGFMATTIETITRPDEGLTLYDRAILVACPTCGAVAGIECDAPLKRKHWEELGSDESVRHHVLHVSRQDRGSL